jgi:hypothetical protein
LLILEFPCFSKGSKSKTLFSRYFAQALRSGICHQIMADGKTHIADPAYSSAFDRKCLLALETLAGDSNQMCEEIGVIFSRCPNKEYCYLAQRLLTIDGYYPVYRHTR